MNLIWEQMEFLGLLLLSLYFVASMSQLPSQDIMALLEFKKGIKHDPAGYVLSSWNEESIDFNGCPFSWNGIVCNGGNVAGVVLDNLGLSADADLSVFVNLTMLVKLSMSNNSISGRIPDNIGSFSKLEYLDLSDNLFSSSLPSGIGSLESLQSLSLAGNNFSALVPDSVSGLSSIRSLDLSRNSFSGFLPSSLTKLKSLVYLNLSHNEFVKKIPKGFDLLPNLQVLDLHSNMLDGNLDKEFFLFTRAVHIDFSDNLLANSGLHQKGFIPGISETIQYLNLSSNRLTGSLLIPGEAEMFVNLTVLDLSYNMLTGELPEFNFVYGLEVLRLGNNRFSGFVPNNLLKGDALVLSELDLSGNNLSGPLSMITSSTLRAVNLSSNGLSGELPPLTGDCAMLDLSNNQFGGNLARISKWVNIEYLDLSQNRLTGPIPNATSQFLRLNYVNFSHNSLTGNLPSFAIQYPKLSALDLSFNQLDGPLDTYLLSLSTLQELYLSRNSFSGNINFVPPAAESRLEVLDLSYNSFGGYFPDQLVSLTELHVLNLAGNNLSGSLPTSINQMSSLTSLDLSQNYFTGPLPNNLSANLQSFNVSYNDLSGVLPESLQRFPRSSFYPGNSELQIPNSPSGPGNPSSGNSKGERMRTVLKVVIIVACIIAFFVLILLAIFIHYIQISRRPLPANVTTKSTKKKASQKPSSNNNGRETTGSLVVSAGELVTARKSEAIGPSEKATVIPGLSPTRSSHLSWSPESGDSFAADSFSKIDVTSPDSRLAGELHFLDDTISLTPEELSKAPAEVLGRSSHGTSYRATLDNGMFLTVKWLREGVARPRKDFAKEAKKFANIRHPNVVALRGYYWGPTQHEKLILSDFISPGSLVNFLYDRPGRRGPPLTWVQRLKIAVDVARGLNYLHFDRALPHGNLKANNVLLDGPELNARITDYCLHRLMTQAGTTEQILDAGVLGYRAPELAVGSKKPVPSFKSDVYAFGVILLELLTGKCAGDVVSVEEGGVGLTEWVRIHVAEGRGPDCFDPVLVQHGDDQVTRNGMRDVLGIALRCIRSISERPGIKTIYEDLSSV
ncbi:LRR receptor-like serine/threonine-protein kinase GHR1-like protein [Drosera capensis]